MRQHIFIRVLILALILAPVFSLSAMDIGLTLDQSVSYEDSNEIGYSGTVIPWFSTLMGSSADFYFSAGANASYDGEEWKIVPELLRTELSIRMKENGEIKIGRMSYSDPLGFVVSGLLDGIRFTVNLGPSTLGLGAWYTGLLYKKNAHITMTDVDLDLYDEELDYGSFYDTYFAPKRLVAAIDWEHPGINEVVRLKLSLLGQFDLSGNDSLYHTQYFVAKASIPVNDFVFDLGVCGELAEMGGRFQGSFAGEFGLGWFLPTKINDRLMFLGRFSGGTIDENIVAFVPVTTVSQGSVLKAKFSGISMLSLDYTARLHRTFSISLQNSYFILSDKGTFAGPPGGKDGYFLGDEVYGMLIWNPLSDVYIRLGGGAFLPMLGNADKDSDVIWRVDLNIVLALL